ncbi:VOC family protein [Labrenzia sp. CE80]|uniref:VOC family protein n=1 Tax=Labrenzia sp. CE80 TaxID=1788986 RepID=UPI00129A2088|nr:VOC family protein [Labrenzia sp. CE80]
MPEQVFTGFHHYAVRSPDLHRSVQFFKELGFRQVHSWTLPDYEIDHAVMMQAPDGKSWIEFFDLHAKIPMQGEGAQEGQQVSTGALAHICLSVADLERASDRIVAAGAKHLHGPEELAIGDPVIRVKNAIFEGLAGEIIELLQPVRFPGDRSV